MADENKKYFWLKLDRNFFKRHDITIVESMENGKDYVLFYLKLLVESIDHEGYLRFSETVPYNEKMLSTITNTNIDIVRSAIKLFKELHLMEMLDDQTIYINETKKMLGESTSKYRVREFRERQKQLNLTQNNECNVTETLRVTEIDKEIDKEIDIDIYNIANKYANKTKFIPPTIEEVKNYCEERKNEVDYNKWWNFYNSKNWFVGKNKMKNWKSAVITWETPKQKNDNALKLGVNL